MRKILSDRNDKFHLIGIFCFLSLTSTSDTQSIYKFLTIALQYGVWDPWESAKIGDSVWALGDPGPFVYPFGMYLILLPARALTYFLGLQNINYSPLGACVINLELTIFIYICSVYAEKIIRQTIPTNANLKIDLRYLLIYSPMIAVSFFFGRQLDIIPTTITVIAVYFLLKGKLSGAGLLIGLGIAVKSYPALLLLPASVYIFIFSANIKSFLLRIISFAGPALFVPVIGTIVFFSDSYKESVLLNPSLKRLFWFVIYLGGNWSPVILFPAACIILIIFQLYLGKKISDKKFVGIVSIYLLLPCVLASPMVMWWTWSAPFLLVFAFLEYQENPKANAAFLKIILFLGILNVTYSLFDNWSYLTQIATWYKSPWPLSSSPQAMISNVAGSENAEFIRASLFSIQWGVAMYAIFNIIKIINRNNIVR